MAEPHDVFDELNEDLEEGLEKIRVELAARQDLSEEEREERLLNHTLASDL